MDTTPQRDVCAVLLVEDDEDDYLIASDMLSEHGRVEFQVDWASTFEEALAQIAQQRHDVYIIDYRLGSRTGLEVVREAFATRSQAPVIMLTGQVDVTVDLEASALGVTDFLIKGELSPDGLERSIRYAVSHHRALRDLARSEERYALATTASGTGTSPAPRCITRRAGTRSSGWRTTTRRSRSSGGCRSCTRTIWRGSGRQSTSTWRARPSSCRWSIGCGAPTVSGGGC
jgi:DNA-binding NtrC family response regulator